MIRKMRERESIIEFYTSLRILFCICGIYHYVFTFKLVHVWRMRRISQIISYTFHFVFKKSFNTKHVKNVHLLVNFNKSNITWYLKLPWFMEIYWKSQILSLYEFNLIFNISNLRVWKISYQSPILLSAK